ncbi:MAG: pseudouridine-5'-phosphate glycosidase, partial [Dermatophilaceae bacterium]
MSSTAAALVGPVVVHEKVRAALDAGRGVVALESTILAHGLPHPDNIEIAGQIEGAVRDGGSVPATIALLDGVVHIGLGPAEVERICSDPEIAKLSMRDVGVASALGRSGATTVASTSALANLVGIRVFATGGLGGVHRGASTTFDVSADLGVIASTPVLIVCAGVKSILDVAGTLEYLETLS